MNRSDHSPLPSRRFSSKLLLFGEYSVLHGSQACAFPYPRFGGALVSGSSGNTGSPLHNDSNRNLSRLFEYLTSPGQKEVISGFMDLDSFRRDISEGMWFDSDIPPHYGLGSSGALVAALFDRYGTESSEKDLAGLRQRLALIESFFHSKSSGTDPLVSYLNQPVFITPEGIKTSQATLDDIRKLIRIDLIDSGTAGETKTGVSAFEKEFLVESGNRRMYESEYIPLVNRIISDIETNLPAGLFENCLRLARFQTELFPGLFTPEMLDLSRKGIESGSEAVKLCGSGGGGYFIRIRPVTVS